MVEWAWPEPKGTLSALSGKKPLSKPVWYKNTYFVIAGLLFLLAIIGLPFVGGDNAIRDPGQKRESGLFLFYLGASVVMLVNGFLSHRQNLMHYEEDQASNSA